MLNHFKTYFPCSNLKSAAVAKKTQGQLRDDAMTQKGARVSAFLVSETITNRVLYQISNLWF